MFTFSLIIVLIIALSASFRVEITRSGTASAWITFRAFPGERPIIISPTWNAIRISGASYIEINGEVTGISSPISSNSGSGIIAYDRAHHIRIPNNDVHGRARGTRRRAVRATTQAQT